MILVNLSLPTTRHSMGVGAEQGIAVTDPVRVRSDAENGGCAEGNFYQSRHRTSDVPQLCMGAETSGPFYVNTKESRQALTPMRSALRGGRK